MLRRIRMRPVRRKSEKADAVAVIRQMLFDHPSGLSIDEIHGLAPCYGLPFERIQVCVGWYWWGGPKREMVAYSHEASVAISWLLGRREITVIRGGKLTLGPSTMRIS